MRSAGAELTRMCNSQGSRENLDDTECSIGTKDLAAAKAVEVCLACDLSI